MYNKFVNIAPFIMLIATGLSRLLYYFFGYLKVFDYLPDLVGYSIFTNLIILKIYMAKRYCHTTRFAVYGLIAMNVVSLITINTRFYTPLYDPIITLIILAVVYYLRKKDGFRNITG